MELALGALAKIGGLLTGGGGAAAGAASAGLSGGQILTSAISAIATIGSGMAAMQAANEQAVQTELQAGQDQVETVQRQTQMKRALLQTLGENEVAFAAAGIDIGSGGIADATRASNVKRATEELSIDRRDADFRSSMFKMRASGIRRQGKSAMGGALLTAVGRMANTALDMSQRGLVRI